MSIDTELIIQILKRSPQGLTPLEILNHLINEPQCQGFSKSSIFSKLLPKLNELRDLQTLVHVSPRWLLMESLGDICEPDVLVESSSQSDCLDNIKIHSIDKNSFDENPTEKELTESFSDVILNILKQSSKGFTPFEILDQILVQAIQDHQTRIDTFVKIIDTLENLRDSQTIVHISPRWLLVENTNTSSSSILDYKINELSQIDNSVDTIQNLDNFSDLSIDSPIEVLKFSLRVYGCLKRNNINTVKELQDLSDVNLTNIKNFGQKSLDEVRMILSKIRCLPQFTLLESDRNTTKEIPSKCFLTISEEIDNAFKLMNNKQEYVLKQRLGFQNGIQRTLEDIGQELGLTRERVRQIEKKAQGKLNILNLNTFDQINSLTQLKTAAINSLYSISCITTLQNWTEAIDQLYPAGEIHLLSVISWFVGFIPEVHILEIADTQLFYMHPISERIISNIQYQISEFWEEQKISDRSQLQQVILPLLPEDIGNPEKAANTLISVLCQEPLPDIFSHKKWNMTDYAYYVLHESGKPLHFNAVGDRLLQLIPNWDISDPYRAAQSYIDRHPDIIRSGSGIYGLRDWGTMEYTHFREVLLDYLSKQSLPADADVIHADLSQEYVVSLATVKMNLDLHPNLFQKFGRSNFYGLKGRYYELPDQILIDLLVVKLEAEPVNLVEIEQDSDLSEYSREMIYMYLNVSPLFWQVGSFKERKFGLSINGKRQYQHGSATQIVSDIFEKIREPLHTRDFPRLIRSYYAYPPGESAFNHILSEDKSCMAILESIYIQREWMYDENFSAILEELDREVYREIIKFTLSSKSLQPNPELLFDWLYLCYQNRFFYRGKLVFEQLNLSELSDKKSAIARKIGQVCQRNGDISSLSFDQDKNSEEVDRNLRLDLEELRQQAKSGQRVSTQGLATLADGKYYARYAGIDVEVHIEKWGGDTTPEMRVLQILCNGEPFDPTQQNPMVNNASLESRLEALQKLYAATLNAYGQVDPYLQIAIGARPTWGGVGYRNLKPILDETT
jgi:hypothetical protein